MKGLYLNLAVVLGFMVTVSSCKQRQFDGELRHDTRNSAGQPSEPPGPFKPPIDRDRPLQESQGLKVLKVQTADQTIAQRGIRELTGSLDTRRCAPLAEGGPRGRSDFDCSEFIEKSLGESFGYEGISIQDWNTKNIVGADLWNLSACRPTQITVSVSSDIARKFESGGSGLGFYVGGSKKNDFTRKIPGSEVLKRGKKSEDGAVAVSFVLLAKCPDNAAEFKPFVFEKSRPLADDIHYWPEYDNQKID